VSNAKTIRRKHSLMFVSPALLLSLIVSAVIIVFALVVRMDILRTATIAARVVQ